MSTVLTRADIAYFAGLRADQLKLLLNDRETFDATQAERVLTAVELFRSPASFARRVTAEWGEPWQPYDYLRYINDYLVRLADPEDPLDRLLITCPPRHGKSLFISTMLPAWYLNRYPDKRVILASYADEFAERWGRDVRNLMDVNSHILDVAVSKASSAGNRWDIAQHRGGMKTAGVGGQITGWGAHLFIIDDPVKDADDAFSLTQRDNKWRWWHMTAQTRFEPGASAVMIGCLVGDTPILMADGLERAIRDVRPGDFVATHEDGRISASVVKNWANQGPDYIYSVTMASGRVVQANERHPFRVIENGVAVWRQAQDLNVGDAVRTANHRHAAGTAMPPRTAEEYAAVTTPSIASTAGMGNRPPSGANGSVFLAPSMTATVKSAPKASACITTARPDGQQDSIDQPRKLFDAHTYATATASTQRTTTGSSASRTESVRSVPFRPVRRTPSGEAGFSLTTATIPTEFADCSATTATSSLGMGQLLSDFWLPSSTYEPGVDVVASVEVTGYEDVFDIEVERTHNFIANGIEVSNTRWHEDDFIGRMLVEQKDRWHHINLPAFAEDDDVMGRVPGQALCPERFDEKVLAAMQRDTSPSSWLALYQQRPTAEGGGRFRRDSFRYWTDDPIADTVPCYQLQPNPKLTDEERLLVPKADTGRFVTIDLALSLKTAADYTVAGVWDIAGWTAPSRLILADLIRLRIEGADHLSWVRGIWESYKPTWIGIEDTPLSMTLISQCRRIGLPVRGLKTETDKYGRTESAVILLEQGRLYFPKQASWYGDLEHELLGFPAGVHDDIVDVVAYGAREFLRGYGVKAHPKPDEPVTTEDKIRARIHERTRRKGRRVHPELGAWGGG